MTRFAVLAALAWGVPAAAQDNDDLLSAWRFRRAVTAAAPGESRLAELELPLEVLAAAAPLQRDLRLIAPDGAEIRTLIERGKGRESRRSVEGRLVDTDTVEKESSTWTADLGSPFAFDEIVLDIAGQDFAKRLQVEAADSVAGPWRPIREDAGVFDRLWGSTRVHHTTIPLKAAETARLFRITADDRTSPRMNLRGASAVGGKPAPGRRWRFPCALEPAPSPDPRLSRYRFRVPPSLPVEAFEVNADDPLFLRPAFLFEETGKDSPSRGGRLGEGTIYRLRVEGAASAGESLAFPAGPPMEGAVILEIDNGDNPPLKNVRAAALGMAVRILFPSDAAARGPLSLYYGNAACRAPRYDLEVLQARLPEYGRLTPASLGPEQPNVKYREAPPVPFAPTSGAPLETALWKWARPLRPGKGENLYAVSLAPEDLSVLRPDLGDLRIADKDDRQVPFLLEALASEAEVVLRPTPEPPPRRSVSRLRLDLPAGPDGRPMILPLDLLLLNIEEPFFSRTARLFEPAAGGRHPGERTLFAGRLERKDSRAAALRINLGGARLGTVFLEIEDGDNAPLTMTSAAASIPLPRAVFKRKADATECRILLGNPESLAPLYDIEVLRREVLACSPKILRAGPLAPNADHRHGFGETLRKAPPTLVLWGGLVAAVIGLLVLTFRLLRKPAG